MVRNGFGNKLQCSKPTYIKDVSCILKSCFTRLAVLYREEQFKRWKTVYQESVRTIMVPSSELFQHLNFLIVVKNAKGLEPAHITAQLLRSNGCNRCQLHEQYLEDDIPKGEGLRNWFVKKFGQQEVINFIITEDCDFPFYEIAAFDFLIPVVTSEWVSTCLSTNRHHRTSGFSPDDRHILKDLQIYVSRHAFNHSEYLFYTEMVHAMGGTCIDFLSSKTTHLVTQDANDPAVKAVLGFGQVNSINFVYPTWIVRCFKTLEVATLEEHLLDPQASFEASTEKLQDLWASLDENEFKRTSSILEGHSFVIGLDVSVHRNLYATLIEFLQANGGTVIRHIDEDDIRQTDADCYIGSSIMSKEYDAAKESGLELGNLIWLFHMWSSKRFLSAKSKLIFSPFKRKLFDTNELILSYSNYYGQQRFYIQRLTELLGGYSTGELSRKNTHLLSQLPWGKKFKTAKKWEKCTVVNHLWLEGTYENGKVLDPLEARFQQFPVKGGLEHAIGQLGSDGRVLQHSNAVPPEDAAQQQHNSQEKSQTSHNVAETNALHLQDGQRTSSQLVPVLGDPQIVPSAIEEEVILHQDTSSVTTPATISEPTNVEDKAEASPDDITDQASEIPRSQEAENQSASETGDNTLSKRTKSIDSEMIREESKEPTAELPEPEQFGVETKELLSKSGMEKTATPDLADPQSQMDKGQLITPTSGEEKISRSQTPLVSSLPSQTLNSSGGRRAAKAKAARKLHSDIELLNEFQRSSKRKKTIDLLPEEVAQLERHKLLVIKADEILQKIRAADESTGAEEVNRRRKQVYNMDAICTGCHDEIGELDRILLEKLGIRVHEEITKTNFSILNTIIAPKKMRTAKFLKSFAFHPLRHALRPEFLTDLLQRIHGKVPGGISLDLSNYTIPEVDTEKLLQATSLPRKVFERAGLSRINLVNDITGGVEVITSILKAHGIKDVKVVPTTHMNQLTIKDLALNDTSDSGGGTEHVPDCVLIAMKSSQVKHFKRIVKNECTTAMAVEWNWCISSIFQLEVDYSDAKNTIFRQDQSHSKRRSK